MVAIQMGVWQCSWVCQAAAQGHVLSCRCWLQQMLCQPDENLFTRLAQN
jgi:hypothetical protein